MTRRSLGRGCAVVLGIASALVMSNGKPVARGAQVPPTFDLLIRNGRVLDPTNGVDAVLDVAVSGTKIARVAPGIDPAQARRVVDATGLHIVPGLIDIHSHVSSAPRRTRISATPTPLFSPTTIRFAAARRRSWTSAAPDGETSCNSRNR